LDSQVGLNEMESFATEIKRFNRSLAMNGALPPGIEVLHPFRDDNRVLPWSDAFYDRFYSDLQSRYLILGINPGRLGAGQTGIPFTDTKRLFDYFGLGDSNALTHETSSAFVYKVIDAFGGAEHFYKRFLVSSVSPLGFVSVKSGKEVNFNYYDSAALQKAVTPFIVQCMETQLSWPINREVVFCLGTGKNLAFLNELNKSHRWFERVVGLEHPRYIMQYKSKQVDAFIEKYLQVLGKG
jgi:hypothetical protein